MSIATELGTRIAAMRYESLPPEAVHWAKVSIIDTIGCALAGANEDCAQITERVITTPGETGPSLIWGSARRVAPLHAAVVNGTAAHALDYDDISNSLAGHPSAPVLPAIWAAGEQLGASGRDILIAYITGFEIQARIGRGVHLHHYQKGWHPTATLGTFGAAAGAARLLGLTPEQTARTLAIAVSLAAGVKANFGTMTKPLHAGQCAMNGLYAAMLAKEGLTANVDAFEHKQGFLEVFNGAGNYDAGKILEDWDRPLDVLNPGVGVKQYPCCGSTHSAIDAMILLKNAHGLTPDNVASIESVTHKSALAHTDRPDPRSALDAKFSVQYCVARALMHGAVKFEHFDDDACSDPEVREVLARVKTRAHPHSPRSMDEHYEGEVIVTLRDGRTFSAKVHQPLRGPLNQTPPDRMEAKFQDCATRTLRPDTVSELLGRLKQLESVGDVREVSTLMAASIAGAPAARAAA